MDISRGGRVGRGSGVSPSTKSEICPQTNRQCIICHFWLLRPMCQNVKDVSILKQV